MTQDTRKRVHRHPDAVAYLEGLPEQEADVLPPLVRMYDGGFTQYWMEGGKVQSRDITDEDLPLAGLRPDSGPLAALLASVSGEFGPQFSRLAAELSSPVPDFDAVELAVRGSALSTGGTVLKALLEQIDQTLPKPECSSCGKPMRRVMKSKEKTFVTRLGPVTVERAYYRCASCGKSCFPLDHALGLEDQSFSAGVASMVTSTVPNMSYEMSHAHLSNLAGVDISSSTLHRWSVELGAQAQCFEQEEVVEAEPPASRMYLSIDGTGIPMRKEEVAGVRGKQEDGSSKSREAKLAVVFTADGRDPETGAALKDTGSETFSCRIDSAAVSSGDWTDSEFVRRLEREIERRGVREADEIVVLSDGAEWIRNACDRIFVGRKVTCILDMYHALEYLSSAVKAVSSDKEEVRRRYEGLKSDIEAGRVADVIEELAPFSDQHDEVAVCCRYFQKNIDRMRYGRYRDRGMQVGSGVVESGCRQIGLRLKRSGTRWSKAGANSMLTLKTLNMNNRVVDFIDWRTKHAIAA